MATELQLHEAQGIKRDKKALARVLKSYEMMPDFYGMKLVDKVKGTIQRAANWKGRYRHLNWSTHNYSTITRIMKSLGELGYEHLKTPFVEFVLTETLENGQLKNCLDSCVQYWLHTIKSSKDRKRLTKYFDSHYDAS
ncbi:opioid growth factor receptor-like protein 1 [Ptychodera flava]|uniref:opioid growth factor receptor-like protein 1 n=1 Tax=Ptychodera flava TaxID=63121 RepID=UPI00396A3CE2